MVSPAGPTAIPSIPGTSPKTIDLTSLNTGLVAAMASTSSRATTLTICYGRERPREFEKRPSDIAPRLPSPEDRTPTLTVPGISERRGLLLGDRPMAGGPRGASFPTLDDQRRHQPHRQEGPRRRHVARPGLSDQDSTMANPTRSIARCTRWRARRDHLFESCREAGVRPQLYSRGRAQPDGIPAGSRRAPLRSREGLGIEVIPAEVRREATRGRVGASRPGGPRRRDRDPGPARGRQAARVFAHGLQRPRHPLRRPQGQGRADRLLGRAGPGRARRSCRGSRRCTSAGAPTGFEVIGAELRHQSAGGPSDWSRAMALPWPQVFVPGDDRTRRLWNGRLRPPDLPAIAPDRPPGPPPLGRRAG